MYERTKVTISFLAERPLTKEEAEVVNLAILRAGNLDGLHLPQQVSALSVEQTPVLSDE